MTLLMHAGHTLGDGSTLVLLGIVFLVAGLAVTFLSLDNEPGTKRRKRA